MTGYVRDMEIHPHHSIGNRKLICELRKTPTVLYGIFVELVQQFWRCGKEGRLFGTPDITWDRDPEKTQVWIDTELRWEAEHPEFRPAIYVRLSPIRYGTVTGGHNALVRRDIQEAEYHYSRTGEGQVSFVHVGSTSGEACSMADATMDYLDAFSPVIADDFCFNWFRLSSREPLHAMSKDSNEKYGSTISYDYRFTESWVLKQESPKLRALVVKTRQAAAERLGAVSADSLMEERMAADIVGIEPVPIA